MADWLAKLKGEESDLRVIAELLHSPDLSVTKESDDYYLTCTELPAAAAVDEVRARAGEILRRASAAERVRSGSSLPIECDEVIRVNADGSRQPFSSASIRHTWNVRVGHSPVTEEGASAFAAWVTIAGRDPRVDKALKILIDPEYSYWFALYNILDVVIGDVGGRIWREGWATEDEVRLFKHTANSVTTLGDAARHGRDKRPPPECPMTLSEAERLIRKILRLWLKSKVSEH